MASMASMPECLVAPRDAFPPAVPLKHCASKPVVGDTVEYHSTSNGRWVPAKILKVNEELGTYDLHIRAGASLDKIRVRANVQRKRVLLYGDSLTAGYYNQGLCFAPYGQELARALAPEFDVEVQSCGCSGRTVEKLIDERLSSSIVDAAGRRGTGIERILDQKGNFDLVVIMAGTNDIGKQSDDVSGKMQTPVASSIRKLHKICHDRGLATVALTVPPGACSTVLPEYRRLWLETNAQLKQWATGADQPPALLVNTEELVPFPHSRYWDSDNLHFSASGSAALGRKLAPLLAPLLRCPSAAPEGETLYLPRALHGRPILRKIETGRFVVEDVFLKEVVPTTGTGVGFRQSMDLDDRCGAARGVLWGEVVEGLELGEEWLLVKPRTRGQDTSRAKHACAKWAASRPAVLRGGA